MKVYVRFLFSLFLILFWMVSCSDDQQTKDVLDIATDQNKNSNNVSIEDKSDKILSEKAKLLDEIDICGNRNDTCIVDPVFFPLHEFKEMGSGFALRFHYPNESNKRKTFVYIRDKDGLKCINKFQGPIITNDTTKSDFPDLLIRFIEPYKEHKFFYNCWFTYSVDEMKYIYKDCYSINKESTQGYQFDVYSSKEASERDKVQTNREVEEILKDYGYFL